MTPFVDDADFRLYVGDVRVVLAELPAESVHCVVTSPPYWGLRDYGTGAWDGGDPDCDHVQAGQGSEAQGAEMRERAERRGYAAGNAFANYGDRMTRGTLRPKCGKCGATRVDQQLGLEATPELFVAAMVDVFREVRRVLRRDGTCWVNLGDSYNANQGSGFRTHGEDHNERKAAAASPALRWGKPKDLVGIPWRVAFALQADGWYLRSDIVWAKPNPMPESVTDRPTKAHEYVFLLTRSPRYFFDADAVREPAEYGRRQWTGDLRSGTQNGDGHRSSTGSTVGGDASTGRNVRSVWEIATQPYPDAHFATFPEELPRRCILAGTSERGCCPVCGAPWERETSHTYEQAGGKTPTAATHKPDDHNWDGAKPRLAKRSETTGWRPTCDDGDHGAEAHAKRFPPVPCTVLDPFMGSGTTALVARKLGRRSIGIELNPQYAALCARRLQQLSLFGAPS